MKINPIIYVAFAVIVLGVLFFIFKPKTNQQNPTNTQIFNNQQAEAVAIKTVLMKPNTFEPSTLTIQKNTKVIFKNEDTKDRWPASAIHPTHGIYPEFDPKQNIKPGDEWSFVFDKIGSWKYHDHLNPSVAGTITVVDGPITDKVNQPNTFELVVQNKKLVSGPSIIKVNQDDDVTIKITSDVAEELHLHAYDNSVELEPGIQATLTFTAKMSGRFPFELEKSKTELGAVEVQPK